MHQGSVLSQFLFAVVVDVVTEFAQGCAEFPYADDLVLISETFKGLVNNFSKWEGERMIVDDKIEESDEGRSFLEKGIRF